MHKTGLMTIGVAAIAGCAPKNASMEPVIERIPGAQPRNVVFILSDDHRYDYMGFLGTVPWLQTPNMDFMAANGAYVRNAFVTTSLSSPSCFSQSRSHSRYSGNNEIRYLDTAGAIRHFLMKKSLHLRHL